MGKHNVHTALKIPGIAFLFLAQLFSCSSKQSYNVKELSGNYVYCTYSGKPIDGLNREPTVEYHLFLQADSTYNEIHKLNGNFEPPDFWGTWEVRGDSIFLSRQGELLVENGAFLRADYSGFALVPYQYSGWKTARVMDTDPRHIFISVDSMDAVLIRQ